METNVAQEREQLSASIVQHEHAVIHPQECIAQDALMHNKSRDPDVLHEETGIEGRVRYENMSMDDKVSVTNSSTTIADHAFQTRLVDLAKIRGLLPEA